MTADSTASQVPARLAALIDEYLLWWVLASVAVGLLVPSIAVLTVLSTPILAVMIDSSTSYSLVSREMSTVSPLLLGDETVSNIMAFTVGK